MQRFTGYSRLLATGAPAPNATVTVYDPTGTLTLASIYSDNGTTPTPKANPFTADANGFFQFYAEDGNYDVRLSGGGIVTPYTWGDQQLWDARNAPGWHNVKEYGAVGDGVTNDLPAFQAAVAAACPGGTVYIPALTNNEFYNLSTGWLIENCRGIRIVGEGATSVIAATSASASALRLWNCPYFQIHGVTVQGVAGGGNGIEVGKSDLTAPSFYGSIIDCIIPPNLQGDGIVVHHGMGLVIQNVMMNGDPTRPSTSATLNGGVNGPNVSTTTSKAIYIVNNPGRNNAISILNAWIDAWRGHGVWAGGVDVLYITGRVIEGCCNNASLLTKAGQITLVECGRVTIDGMYLETTGTLAADNIYAETVGDLTVKNVISSSVSTGTGRVHLIGCARATLQNIFGNGYNIESTCTDVSMDSIVYGASGDTFTDLGVRSIRRRIVNGSASNTMLGGQTAAGAVNLLRNPGLEQWTSATVPVELYALNCTVTRCGTGEADTTKFRGRYSARVDTRVDPTNGLVIDVADYGDATLRAAMVNRKLTVSYWINVTAGTVPQCSAFYDGGAVTDDGTLDYNTATAGWQKVSRTFIVRSGYTTLSIRLVLGAATVVYVDEVSLVVGSDGQTPELANRATVDGPYGHHVVTFSGTPTFDQGVAPLQAVTLTANITGITLTGGVPGKMLTLRFIQNAAGGWTVGGWPASVRWSGGAAPVVAAGANAISTVTLIWDGTNWFEVSRVLGY